MHGSCGQLGWHRTRQSPNAVSTQNASHVSKQQIGSIEQTSCTHPSQFGASGAPTSQTSCAHDPPPAPLEAALDTALDDEATALLAATLDAAPDETDEPAPLETALDDAGDPDALVLAPPAPCAAVAPAACELAPDELTKSDSSPPVPGVAPPCPPAPPFGEASLPFAQPNKSATEQAAAYARILMRRALAN